MTEKGSGLSLLPVTHLQVPRVLMAPVASGSNISSCGWAPTDHSSCRGHGEDLPLQSARQRLCRRRGVSPLGAPTYMTLFF